MYVHTWAQIVMNTSKKKTHTLVVAIYEAEFTAEQIWAPNTFEWERYHSRDSFITLHCHTGGTFMNRLHLELQHFSEHAPRCVCYAVQRCLSSLTACHVNVRPAHLVLLWFMLSVSLWLCAGEGCSRSHPAADVAGEGSARGEGDRADCCRIRQQVSQVSARVNTRDGGELRYTRQNMVWFSKL